MSQTSNLPLPYNPSLLSVSQTTNALKRKAEDAGLDAGGDGMAQGEGNGLDDGVPSAKKNRAWLVEQVDGMERSFKEACYAKAIILRFHADIREQNLVHLHPSTPRNLIDRFRRSCAEWQAARSRVEGYLTEADRLSSERTAWLRLKANEEASKAALAKESAVNAEKATTEGIVKQAAGEKETTVDDKGADGDEEKDQKEEKLQTTEDQKTTSVVGSSSSTPNNNHIQNLVPFTFKTPEELLAIGTLPAPTTTISEEPEAQSQSQTQQVQQQQPPQQSQPQSQPPQLTLQTHQDPSTSTAAPPETEDFMHFLKSAVGSPVGDQVAEGSETNGGMGMSGQQGVEGENLMAALEASVAASVSGVNHGLNTDQGNQSEQQQMTDGSTAEGNINNMSSEEIMRALEQWDSLGGNEAGGGGGEGMLGNNFDGEQNVDNNDMTALPDAQSLPTTTGQNQVVNESQADQDLFDLLASFPDAGGNVAADGGDPSTLNFGNGQDNNLNFDLPMDLGLPQDQSEQQMFNQTEGVLPPNNNNNQPEFDISQFSDLLSGFPELAMPDGSGNGGNGQVGEGAFEEFREGGVEGDAGGEDDIMKLLAGIGGDQ